MTFLLTWLLSSSLNTGLIGGVVALIGMLLINPERWLKRLAWASFSAFVGTLYLNFHLAYEKQLADGSFKIEFSDPPTILSLGLLVISLVCILAQVWQEKQGK